MNHGGGVSGCSTPETPRVQGSSSAGLEGDPKNCISSRFLRGANAHGLGPRSDHGFYIPDYLQSFLHRLQCWLSGCDELIRQQQDKTKFSPPCYSCILINICFLLGSLEKKKIIWCVYLEPSLKWAWCKSSFSCQTFPVWWQKVSLLSLIWALFPFVFNVVQAGVSFSLTSGRLHWLRFSDLFSHFPFRIMRS